LAAPLADSQGVDAEEEEEADPDRDLPHSLESFRLLCGDADADALRGFLSRVSEDDSNVSPIILSPDADKAHRSVGLILPTLLL
jgi:tRNA pseudouridine13 synthase